MNLTRVMPAKGTTVIFSRFSLYPVLDTQVSRSGDPVADLHAVCGTAIRILQVRAKDYGDSELLELARTARRVTRERGILLVINDRPDIAVAVGADGVHVGQRDVPIAEARRIVGRSMLVGGSAESVEEAVAVQAAGGDYVGAGSVFPTSSKADIGVLGLEGLGKVREAVTVPVVAIGGISVDNFLDVVRAGTCVVAVISGVFMAEDIRQRVGEFHRRYHGCFGDDAA